MLKIEQIRYFGDGNEKNAYYDTWPQFCGDASFTAFTPIRHIGIQTIPGTRFYLNKSITPIIVGSTGVYELDLERDTSALLYSLRFDRQSMQTLNELPNGYLILDLVYESEG